jgi:hypothetical protein
MKTFKRASAAKAAANGLPIIRIGLGKKSVWIVTDEPDLVGVGLTEVSVIAPDGCVTGFVTLRHLDRLGNANWASCGERQSGGRSAFPAGSRS